MPRITARRRGSGWGSATGPECRRPRSAKRIDSPSMMHGSSARSGRLCPAITARGRSDSMVSRVVIVSRRRPVPDPGGGPQPRPVRPCRRPGRSRRDVGGLGRCRWWCTRDLDPTDVPDNVPESRRCRRIRTAARPGPRRADVPDNRPLSRGWKPPWPSSPVFRRARPAGSKGRPQYKYICQGGRRARRPGVRRQSARVRARGNNVRPSGHDPSAELRSGFTFQEEPASRATRPPLPIPHGGTSPGPDAAAAPARPDPHRPAFSRSAAIPR